MKLITIVGSCLFLTLVVVPEFYHANAQSVGYPMTCQGGGNMRVSLNANAVEFTFTRATQGAGTRAPRPGECAWLDRGVLPTEPTLVRWSSSELNSLRVTLDAEGRLTNFSIAGRDATQYYYLKAGILTGKAFQIHVTRVGAASSGTFLVTKIGP